MADPRQHDITHAQTQAGRRAADAIGRAAQATTDSSQDATRASLDAARTAAETGEHAAQAGADFLESTGRAVEEAWRSGLDVASHFAERSSGQMGRALGLYDDKTQDAAGQSSRNIDAILQSSRTFAETFKNLSREWSSFYRERMDRNIEKMDAIMRSRTPQELVAAQSDLLRDNLEGFLKTSRRVAETSMHLADEASRRATRAVR